MVMEFRFVVGGMVICLPPNFSKIGSIANLAYALD